MDLAIDFVQFLKKYKLENSKFLLGVSGGVDSVVLANLFAKYSLNFDIAHCNYQLRGDASEVDEQFVSNLAKSMKVKLFLKKVNLKETSKNNIQEEARNIRYDFFNSICKQHDYQYIVSAHHKDDKIETFFINMLRGSGLKGITALKDIHGNRLRPLLRFDKKQIIEYAKKQNLEWREDASNSKLDYLRNKIRHKVIPELNSIQPNFKERWIDNINQVSVTNEWAIKCALEWNRTNVLQIDEYQYIKNDNIIISNTFPLFLFLKQFGLNYDQTKDIIEKVSLKDFKKRFWKSFTYVAIQERDGLYIKMIQEKLEKPIIIEAKEQTYIYKNREITVQIASNIDIELIGKQQFIIDFESVNGTIELRTRNSGDFFYLDGIKNKQKLKSYFINNKFSEKDKNETLLLANGNEVLWILGWRKNKKFNPASKNLFVIEIK